MKGKDCPVEGVYFVRKKKRLVRFPLLARMLSE
jgi:hypothetical protein